MKQAQCVTTSTCNMHGQLQAYWYVKITQDIWVSGLVRKLPASAWVPGPQFLKDSGGILALMFIPRIEEKFWGDVLRSINPQRHTLSFLCTQVDITSHTGRSCSRGQPDMQTVKWRPYNKRPRFQTHFKDRLYTILAAPGEEKSNYAAGSQQC